MSLAYGFVKCKVVSNPKLQSSRHKKELQYHLHATLDVAGTSWDTAINVGTNDADDLLRYRLVFDFQHAVIESLRGAAAGFQDLTDSAAFPSLDFLRSDVLKGTGAWRDSDVMDGSVHPEPVASMLRLLTKAQSTGADVYIFGRKYLDGNGIHDVHMNQGSGSDAFLNNGVDDHNDHNAIWQDGAVLVDFGDPEMAGYFTAFTQQLVPTDDLGNPSDGGHEITDDDPGSMAG